MADLMEESDTCRRNVYRYIKLLNESGFKIKNTVKRGPGERSRFRLIRAPRTAEVFKERGRVAE